MATSTDTAKRKKILQRAAWYLDDYAQCSFNGGTVHGKWVKGDHYAEELKIEHDETRSLARALRRMSRGK